MKLEVIHGRLNLRPTPWHPTNPGAKTAAMRCGKIFSAGVCRGAFALPLAPQQPRSFYARPHAREFGVDVLGEHLFGYSLT